MFYTFRQNNSFGKFKVDDNVSHYVIVEATTAEDANKRAEGIGIYFNGVRKGEDCGCCGDRWDPVTNNDGFEEPTLYCGKSIEETLTTPHTLGDTVIIYYQDGSKKVIR